MARRGMSRDSQVATPCRDPYLTNADLQGTMERTDRACHNRLYVNTTGLTSLTNLTPDSDPPTPRFGRFGSYYLGISPSPTTPPIAEVLEHVSRYGRSPPSSNVYLGRHSTIIQPSLLLT